MIMYAKKQVIIMRGLPGSGKDRKIRELMAGAVVCSADNYFMVDGEYKFDPMKLGEAHAACLRRFLEALKLGRELVVVNNTNAQRWEFANYVLAAELVGYEVRIEFADEQPRESKYIDIDLVRTCAQRNVHGVPLASVAAMAARWED